MTEPARRDARSEQLAANLARLDERLTAACAAAGRSRDEITVVAAISGG